MRPFAENICQPHSKRSEISSLSTGCPLSLNCLSSVCPFAWPRALAPRVAALLGSQHSIRRPHHLPMRPRAAAGGAWASLGSAPCPGGHWVGENPLAEERVHEREDSHSRDGLLASVSSGFRKVLGLCLRHTRRVSGHFHWLKHSGPAGSWVSNGASFSLSCS